MVNGESTKPFAVSKPPLPFTIHCSRFTLWFPDEGHRGAAAGTGLVSGLVFGRIAGNGAGAAVKAA